MGMSKWLFAIVSVSNSFTPLEIIFFDVWGPTPTASAEWYKYYLFFEDGFSLFCWIYPMYRKSKVTNLFLQFKTILKNQIWHKIKIFQFDWSNEYRPIQHILNKFRIVFQHPYRCTHNQNEKIEHKYMIETILSLFAHSHMPFNR